MRLLYLSTVFPRPDDLTRGIFCYHLCRALAARHEVRIFSPRSWLESFRNRPGRTVRAANDYDLRSDWDVIYPRYYYPPRLLPNTHGWFMWQSVRRRLRGLLRSFRPDCVLSYWAYPDGEVANRAARLANVPCVAMVGGSDVLLCDQSGRRQRVTAVLRDADAVMTIGDDLRRKVIDLGVDADRVHVMQRGVDTHRFCPGDRREARKRLGIPLDGPTLLWVGRMVPVKGLTILLEACAQLQASGTHFRLYLVGDGPLRTSLERACDALHLTKQVTFAGIHAHHELPDWYRAADLTVLPSLSEGVPNVLRESLACGTPFVASRVGGIPELSADPLNRLAPPGDARALAEVIAQALADGAVAKLSSAPVIGWNESAESLVEVIRGL